MAQAMQSTPGMKHAHISTAAALLLAASTPAPHAAAQGSPRQRYTAEIRAAAQRDMASLRACYAREREEGRRAWARIQRAAAVVEPDGRITQIAVTPAVSAPAIEACLRPIVEAWRLTPPPGGVAVSLSWTRAEMQRAARARR